MSVAACLNIQDLRRMASSRLPLPMFDYIDGGADDERSLKRNREAFNDYSLLPEYLVDVGSVDTSTALLGKQIALPIILSPTGMTRLFHHDKELAVARAAEKSRTFYALSTLGTTSLEDVAKTISSPKMFQLYILKDRELTLEFVERCKVSGYDALCLTIDMPVAGNRERDHRSGMIMPPRFGVRSLLSYATHPAWAIRLLTHPEFRLANVAHRVDALGAGAMGLIAYVNGQFDRTVTWKDVEWLRNRWDGKLVIKGILSPADALRARACGVDAVMISNHGGRQLDSTPAPIDMLGRIRDSIGSSMELIVDGGIQRGSDVAKALALGANACSIGKAYLYGLAAGGQPGVERAMTLLRDELSRTMALLGCARIPDIESKHIAPASQTRRPVFSGGIPYAD